MSTILIAKTSRGCFNRNELAKYVVQSGSVIFECRNPICQKIWNMSLTAYKQIDIYKNPIQCLQCDNYDINASWCNFTERPKTYIGEEQLETQIIHPTTYFPNGDIHTEEWIEIISTPKTSYKEDYNSALNQMEEWQKIHGPGSFPDWDTPYYKLARETMWCLSEPNIEHINEPFHEILPLNNGKWIANENEGLQYNHEFYCAIINIIIQTEIDGEVYELIINVDPVDSGLIFPNVGRYFKNFNEIVFLTAIDSINYTFVNWIGDVSLPFNRQTSITMDNNKNIIAKFIKNFTLIVLSQYGTITKTPDLLSYSSGTTVNLTISNIVHGYIFESWTNVSSSLGTTATVIVDYDNKTVRVNFIPDTYLLTINISPINGGITSPLIGEYVKQYNSSVILMATSSANFTFVNWTGDISSTNSQTNILITSNKSVTANFVANYILTIVSEHGEVTKSPDLLSYSPGTTVNLTAVADENYDIIDWTNVTTSIGNLATILMNENKNISVNYSLESRVLTISVLPIDGGTTNPIPGIYIKTYNDDIQVTATNLPNFTFVNWTGDISSTNSQINITMVFNRSVTANFVANYILTIVSEHGEVTKSPDLLSYSPGTTVNLTAVADENYDVLTWNGASTSFGSVATVLMNSNKTVTVNYTLEIRVLNISISPAGVSTTVPSVGIYNKLHGDIVTVTTFNPINYTFVNWTGDISSETLQIEITMNSNKTIVANFAVNYILSVNSPNGTVTKVPNLTSYSPGTIVNLSIVMNQGYEFGSWDNITTELGTTATVLMDSNKTVIVNSVVETKTLIISTLPVGVGDVSPVTGTYLKDYGTVTSVTGSDTLFGVIPNYTFLKWTGDITSIASTLNLTMNRDYSLVANFKTNDDGTSFNGDYIIITYNFTAAGGSDLDTKTQMIAPRTGNVVGYDVSTNDSQYIYWGGDNQGYGAESVYIDVKYTLLAFPTLTNIDVKLKCYWSGVKVSGQMTIDIVAYKGGTMTLLPNPEYRFVNTGGRVVAELHYPFTVNSTSFNTPTTLGTLRYNMDTKSLIWMA